MSGVREHYEWDEAQRLLSEGDAPTPDDVSIALDGWRLDTAEAVIRFFEELRLEHPGRPARDQGVVEELPQGS